MATNQLGTFTTNKTTGWSGYNTNYVNRVEAIIQNVENLTTGESIVSGTLYMRSDGTNTTAYVSTVVRAYVNGAEVLYKPSFNAKKNAVVGTFSVTLSHFPDGGLSFDFEIKAWIWYGTGNNPSSTLNTTITAPNMARGVVDTHDGSIFKKSLANTHDGNSFGQTIVYVWDGTQWRLTA